MSNRRILSALLLMLPLTALGQYIPLCHSGNGDSLALNIDRVWSYNLYEHSRWGAGVRYIHASPDKPRRLVAEGYAGYGIKDKHGKWGLTLDAVRTGRHERHRYVSAAYDLFSVGNRRLTYPTLTDLGGYDAFMSRRLYHAERVAAGWRLHMNGKQWLTAELRYSAEQRLFDNTGLLYPARYHSPRVKTLYGYAEAEAGYWNPDAVTLLLTLGATEESGNCNPLYYLRALAQYDHSFHPARWLALSLFAQGGWCDGMEHHVPYSRMFDLGGTWGAPLYFRNSLLTARPNEFTANAFALLSLHLATREPLWQGWNDFAQIGTYPKPFLGLHAAWGYLWGQDADGQKRWTGLDLQAPHRGFAEATAGIDGLVRWGVVDWGVAAAYRLTPAGAPYHNTNHTDNLALLITAALIF